MAGIFASSFQNRDNGKTVVVRDLGMAYDSDDGKDRPFQANVKLEYKEKTGPGKKFNFDAAVCRFNRNKTTPSSSFFEQAQYDAALKVSIHNINGSWRTLPVIKINGGDAHVVSGTDWFSLGPIKIPTFCYSTSWRPGVGGLSTPAYGFVTTAYTGLNVQGKCSTGDTYSAMESKLSSAGFAMCRPPYTSSPTFVAGEPVGVRYLSQRR